MPSQSAISLAVLQVNWDERKKDYLDNFVPLVAECIRLQKDEVVSTGSLKLEIESRFGLNIPVSPINTMLRRLRKEGYVHIKNRIYHRDMDKLSATNFHKVQQEIITMYDSLILDMITYCSKEFGVNWTSDEAGVNLISCLKENELQIMSAISQGTLIPSTILLPQTTKYYCATYIKHLEDTKSPQLKFVERIVVGNMLANAVFLPDPSRATQKFRKTQVFFDTTFLIFALGYAGEPRGEPCTELLQLLYETGAELRCFQHTVNELTGILETCALRIRSGDQIDSFGTLEYFIEKDYSETDIRVLINNIKKNLSSIRVIIKDKPPYDFKYVIDEEALGKALESEINYHSTQPRDRDVDSVSAIIRFRRMQKRTFIEDCRAIFITTNSAVARVSRRFFSDGDHDPSVSPCITDYSLTNLLWLKKPLKVPDLPMKRIIADCYASLQPDERLIRAYLAKIAALEQKGDISEDDVFMLRYSLEAKQALMDITTGDERVLTNVNLEEILEIIKDRMQSKIRAEVEAKAEKEKGEISEDRDKYKTIAEVQSKELDNAEKIIQELTASEIARNTNITYRAQKISHVIAYSCGLFFILILILGAVFSLPWEFPIFTKTAWRYILATFFLISSVYVIYNLITGVQISSLIRQLELMLEKPIKNIIKKLVS